MDMMARIGAIDTIFIVSKETLSIHKYQKGL